MKKRIVHFAFICQIFIVGKTIGQVQTDFEIIGVNTVCTGDSVTFKVPGEISGNYIQWGISENSEGSIGNEYIVLIREEFGDSISIYCTSIDSNKKVQQDTLLVLVNRKPSLPNSIVKEEADDKTYLEAAISDEYSYKWFTPGNDTVQGNIAKLVNLKAEDYGEYTLFVSDRASGCYDKMTYTLEKDNENISTVFGTNEENIIPDKMYKELRRDAAVYECGLKGENKSNNYKKAKVGTKFTIIGEIDDDYIIRFWKWNQLSKRVGESEVQQVRGDYQINYKIIDDTIKGILYNSKSGISLANKKVYAGGNMIGTNKKGEFEFETKALPITLELIDPSTKINVRGASNEKTRFVIESIPSTSQYTNEVFVYDSIHTSGYSEHKYFRIDKSEVDFRTISILPNGFRQNWDVTAGTVLLPIKIRPGNRDIPFQFSSDIAIGPFFGVKKRLHRYKPMFISFGGTIGISSVSLTPANVDTVLSPSVQNVASLTNALGTVFEYDNIQLGIFIGRDRINNNKSFGWNQHGRTWLSIGFGYSILGRPDRASKTIEGGNN